MPTWQRAELLSANLRSLLEQSEQLAGIIVVGRREDSDARTVVAHLQRSASIPLVWSEVATPGVVPPVKQGLAEVTTAWVAFLDDDVVADRAWAASMTALLALPGIGVAGGRIIDASARFRGGSPPPDAGQMRWYGRLAGGVASLETNGPIDVACVQESNWAWRTDLLRSLWFDPALERVEAPMYGFDLCLQAAARGVRIAYDSAARVTDHPAPRDAQIAWADRPARVVSYTRNYTYIVLKHTRGWRRWVFAAWWWLVGEREAYGVVKALGDLVMPGHDRRTVLRLLRSSMAGRREGVRLWRALAADGMTNMSPQADV